MSLPNVPLSLPALALSALLPLLLTSGLVACSPPAEEVDVAAAPPPVVSGRYDVKGMTRTPGAQDGRRIEGTVILVQTGDAYTATFELETIWPAEGSDTVADVVGVGEGRIEGGRLEGDARTQLVISTVPGVDPGFAFVPRTVTTRIDSVSIAKVSPDGSIEIELENRGAAGEQYEPTRTRLIGRRVAGATELPVASAE